LAQFHHQASNAREKLKDAVTEAKTYGTAYELEVVNVRVHKRFPEVFVNPALD
jgi:hypothetical protein